MSRNRLSYLSQRILNNPLALHRAKAEVILVALADRLGIESLSRAGGQSIPLALSAFDEDDEFLRHGRNGDSGYDVVSGIGVIPVCGTLLHKTGSIRPYSGMQGYDAIRTAFCVAMEDPEVRAIVFDVDSPGGEVSGLFDLADDIYAARGTKPLWSILSEVAYSAAYAIASATDFITVPRTGGTGSVGVVCAHTDWSKALSGAGIAVTFIQHGDQKTDGASEKPLSSDALARFQADIDVLGNLFCETVARNRGIPTASVLAMQAGVFLGDAGVHAGLADAVMAPDAAFRALLETIA